MQEKILQIPFNYKRFIEDYKVVWSYPVKTTIKNYIIYTAIAIICLTVGIITETGKGFPVATIIGGGFLYYLLTQWMGLFERRSKFYKSIKKQARRFEQNSMECIYVFSDEGIEYRDSEKLLKFKWFLFDPFIIYQDKIILSIKDNKMLTYIFNKESIGDYHFQSVCDILREKIGEKA